jgi:hypothetical protein
MAQPNGGIFAIDRHSATLSFCAVTKPTVRLIMSFSAGICQSDDNMQQVVCLVESGKLEAGL